MQHPIAPVPMVTHRNWIEPGKGLVNGPARTRLGKAAETLACGVVLVALATMVVAQSAAALVGGGGGGLLTAPMGGGPLGSGGTTFGFWTGSFAKQTATGNQDITLPAGCPDLTAAAAGTWAIMFSTTGSTQASGTWESGINSSLGFTAGAANSYAVATHSDDAVASSVTVRRMAAKCITIVASGPSTYAEADFVSFPTSTTMRINWTTNTGAFDPTVMFTIYTGLTGAKAVNWTAPATAISKAVTGVGFKPDLVLHSTYDATNALPASNTFAFGGLGGMNKHGQQWANGYVSQTAVNPSNTGQGQQTDAALVAVSNGGAGWNVQAAFVSMDADGFTMNFSTTDSGVQIISLCLGGVSSKLGSFVSSASTQNVSSRHGFTVRGALFSNMSAGPTGAPVPHALWGLGMTDGTNHRSTYLVDVDALTPTKARSVWNSSYPIQTGQNSITDYERGTPTFTTSDFTVTWNLAGSGIEHLYLLIGDSGTNTTPQTLGTASSVTSATATGYSNQKKAVTLSTGRHVAVVADTGTNAKFIWTDDTFTVGGTDYAAPIGGWANGSIACYVDSGGTERLVVVWQQSGTSGTGPTGGARSDGFQYVAVGTFNAGRTTLTWGAALQFNNSSLAASSPPDIVVTAYLTGARAVVTAGYHDTVPRNFVYWCRIDITSGGVASVGVALTQMNSGGSGYGVNVDNFPSCDINPSTGDVYVTASAGTTGAGKGLRFWKLTNNGSGSWTVGTEREIDNSIYVDSASSGVICRVDSTYGVIMGGFFSTGGARVYAIYQRDLADTTTTTLVAQTGTALNTRMFGPGMAIDGATGNIYLFGQADNSTGDGSIAYYKWTRASSTTGSIGSRVITDTPGVGSASPSYVYAWSSGSTIRWLYTAGNNAPYAVKYDQITLAAAPNAPTLTSPASGSYVDVSGGLTVVPLYNSTDGANQNAYALRAKQSGGSYVYWNASSGLWQVSIVWNAISTAPSATWNITVPASATIANGATLNWSAASQEATASLQGPFAADFTIVMQAAPVVTVTAPSGTVTGTLTPTVTWTTSPAAGAAQTAYRVVVYTPAQYGGGGFSPGTTAGYYDSTVVGSSNQSYAIPSGANLAAGVAYRFYVQVTETGGETSTWQYSGATFTVNPPATPTLTAVPGTDGTTGAPRTTLTVQGRENLLSAEDASFESGTVGNWVAGASTAIANSAAQSFDGTNSLALTRQTSTGTASTNLPTGAAGYACTPSQTVTINAEGRAAVTARTCTLTVNWYKAGGAASSVRANDAGTMTDSSSAWTQVSMTVVAPSDAVTFSLTYSVAAAVANEVHYLDAIDFGPGSSSTWTRGGLNSLTVGLVQFSDDNATWTTLRTSGGAFVFPAQTTTLYDYEAPPGTVRYYRAQVQANVGGGSTLLSGFAAASATGTTPSQWVISDPTDPTSAVLCHAQGNPTRQLVGKRTMHAPFNRARQVKVSDGVKGWAGRLPVRTLSTAAEIALESLLARDTTLLIQSPEGGGRQWYANVDTDPTLTQIGTTLGATVLAGVAGRGTAKMPHTDLVLSYAEAERP